MIQNPQRIIDSQLDKFYTKSKKGGQLTDRARKSVRSGRLLEKQNKMVAEIGLFKLASDNKKKLRKKLNQILNEMSGTEKTVVNVFPCVKERSHSGLSHEKSLSNVPSKNNFYSHIPK